MLPLLLTLANPGCAQPGEPAMSPWVEDVLNAPYAQADTPTEPVLQLLFQQFEQLERNESIIHTPLRIGDRGFERGLGTHARSHIRVYSPEPLARFTAWVGVDHNERTQGGAGSVVFRVAEGETDVYRSRVMRGGEAPEEVQADLGGTHVVNLYVDDADGNPACDHADWAEAVVETREGRALRLEELPEGIVPTPRSRYPFSFTYGQRSSDELLPAWSPEQTTERLDEARTRRVTRWADPNSGLRVTWESVAYADFPAVEWLLHFENAGDADTEIIGDVQALDVAFTSPLSGSAAYRVHATRGGTPDPQQFEPRVHAVSGTEAVVLGSGNGRSSTDNLPFFKVEGGDASLVVAVGWSGCWKATLTCPDHQSLNLRAGMERTHFRLHPGERVRSPRVLLLHWPGDTLEANAQFRQLIYRHYCATRDGERPLPLPFCNTCFTRGGGWLNECDAENQISLIRAYAPLGLKALLTDAGWFEGGWPNGAGNWNPRADAYPRGMGPVAQAALDEGMVYGLWFEPERVVAGTAAHREHPDWCLAAHDGPNGTYLLNFGLPEVQAYFFEIVRGFMQLPGFRVYRQDFNMDPLPYWRYNDAPDRQGITEMHYIEGLYVYWDRIRATWPDAFVEECASGGHRIDLETVRRMHAHQKTDYWFDNDVDHAALWSTSQYLPNNTIVAHLIRLDDYSFDSTMASSLCLGWIADAPDFDAARGKALLDRYNELQHLLVGAWYPLLPYTRDPEKWTGMQFHRADLNEGLLLAFRHAQSPYRTVDVQLRGLQAGARYELTTVATGATQTASGAELLAGWELAIPERPGSTLITYRRGD
jgi:alpha-galactosidase